ncbi:hypothetical protein MMB17_18630 [Methylobacterium organophilum]|uniref:hypothetical protein n=1 Tax=Methylobacterium organophilum TaxID=410 RepID=UPI001F13CBF8|nr:hypothetical protein [Methylobacterium organophilum]UMY16679.1 hypothetical protein MMB17_18630 [Methylobacterium organophilum]
MLISEAVAQTAEATKAAAQAADILLQYKVLGAACLLLLLAVAILFWMLIRSHNRHGDLLERVIVAIETSKNASADNAEAVKSQTATITSLTTAVQTLSREFEGETREARHDLRNIGSAIRGIAKRLRASPEDDGE